MSISEKYPIGSYVEVTDEDEDGELRWRGFVRAYGKNPLWNSCLATTRFRVDNGHPTEIDDRGFGRGWTISAWVSPKNCRIV